MGYRAFHTSRSVLALITFAIAAATPRTVVADDNLTTAPTPSEQRRWRWLAVGSLGLTTAGGVTLLGTRSNRWVTPIAAPAVAPGAATLWAAGGAFLTALPLLLTGRCNCPDTSTATTLRLDHAYVYDPQFDYRSLAVLSADIRVRPRLRLRPRLWLATNDDNQRGRAEAMYQLRRSHDGSWLELGGALSHHRFGDEGLGNSGVELFARGRLNLARVWSVLAGTFSQLGLGIGLDYLHTRDAGGDGSSQLLARTSFGIYLPGARGEVELYYDHRRDDYAGGFAVRPANGFLGHFGVEGHYYVTRVLGVAVQAEMGSAYVVRTGVIVRPGATR